MAAQHATKTAGPGRLPRVASRLQGCASLPQCPRQYGGHSNAINAFENRDEAAPSHRRGVSSKMVHGSGQRIAWTSNEGDTARRKPTLDQCWT